MFITGLFHFFNLRAELYALFSYSVRLLCSVFSFSFIHFFFLFYHGKSEYPTRFKVIYKLTSYRLFGFRSKTKCWSFKVEFFEIWCDSIITNIFTTVVYLYETSIEEDQTLDTGQPNNETLDSLSQPGHHPGQKQFKNTKLRSSNSGHSNQTSRKSSSNSKPSASQKSSSLIKYFSGEKTNYSTSNSPITNNSEKSHDSGVVRVSDPRFSESDSCKKKLQRTCHPRDYGEKDLAENMDYKNTHQRDVERELRASENSLYQNSSESFKERDKPQTKIISQQRAIKKTGRTNEKVIPFCSKYRTYGDGQELVGRAESGVNEGNNKNMRYEGSSATAATGKCISTGTGSNNGVANKLTYKT